jgi:hypothetical protein
MYFGYVRDVEKGEMPLSQIAEYIRLGKVRLVLDWMGWASLGYISVSQTF